MSDSAGDKPQQFPMRVGDFLNHADVYLNRGDIILSRNNTLTSQMIRWGTDGFFSHSALVFLLPQPRNGFDNVFVLESVSEGVGVANFKPWVDGAKAAEQVAILRLNDKSLHEDYFKHVGGLMLDMVKSTYDFDRVINMGLAFVFGIRLGIARLQRKRISLKPWAPKSFICSGFIQYGLVEAMRRRMGDTGSVVLKPGLDPNDHQGLLAVSPEDIASSEKVKYLYAIHHGWVHEVKSYAQARAIISGAQS